MWPNRQGGQVPDVSTHLDLLCLCVYCFIICMNHNLMSHVIRVCSSEGSALLLSWRCSVCGHETSSDERLAERSSAEGLSVVNHPPAMQIHTETRTPPARYIPASHTKSWEICIHTSQQKLSWWTEDRTHHGNVLFNAWHIIAPIY